MQRNISGNLTVVNCTKLLYNMEQAIAVDPGINIVLLTIILTIVLILPCYPGTIVLILLFWVYNVYTFFRTKDYRID